MPKRNLSAMITKILLRIVPCLLLLTLPVVNAATTKKSTPTKIHVKKDKKSKKLSHPYPKKLLKDMNESELQEMLPYVKSVGEVEHVYKVFHFLLSHSSDQNNLKNYKIDLADYCYGIKEYEKAAFSYEDFFLLYPGSKEAEYSQYKSILCWFYLCLAPCRDQSFTDKTITLIDDFLKKAVNPKFIDEVVVIRKQCRQKLFEHEIHVFENYLKQKKHASAQKRYEYMEANFKDIQHLDLYLVYCKKIQTIVADPKQCPFLIKFNLKDALPATTTTPEKKAKSALFFLA